MTNAERRGRFGRLAAAALLSLAASLAGIAQAAPREHLIEEPVFGGSAYLMEAGLRHERTVLLVHGLGDNAGRDWAALVPVLAQRFHVIAVDLPGFGHSDRGNEAYTPANYAAFLHHVVATRARGPVYLVGHSMGGNVALYFASSYPEQVQRLVLVSAAGILHQVAYGKHLSNLGIRHLLGFEPVQGNLLERIAGSALERFARLQPDPRVVLATAAMRERALDGDPQRIAGLALALEDHSARIPVLATPTLVIWGEDDGVAPLRTGKLLEARLPRAELLTLRGVGHVPMAELPERFNSLLLARLSAADDLWLLPRAHAAPGGDSTRVGRCEGDSRRIFEGRYARIEVHGCNEVVIRDALVDELVIEQSRVTIENTEVRGGEFGLRAFSSAVQMTGGRLQGRQAILTANSRLDLAGVMVQGAIHSSTLSTLICSICTLDTPSYHGPLHDFRTLPNDSRL